jgi:O-methyltransferase
MSYSPFSPINQMPMDRRLRLIWEKYRDYSMVGHKFPENLMLIDFFGQRVPGDIVECGTWKGGMSCAMMAALGPERSYHFFDSFEGLPDPVQADGDYAFEYKEKTGPDYGMDNCRADYDEFCRLIHGQGVPASAINVYRGWFADTLGQFPKNRTISVLRLDGDFYESTKQCLEALWGQVAVGGIVILDDYDEWEGCARATHEFLAALEKPSFLYRTPVTQVAYILKR